ncbi:MAG: arylesterase [Nitratireductor sp.]
MSSETSVMRRSPAGLVRGAAGAAVMMTFVLAILFPLALPKLTRAAEQTATAPAPGVIVVLGDSLVAGYGLAESDAFPQKLEKALLAQDIPVRVLNAGVSGDTSAGGLARLDWSVPPEATAVIVELGANDALRGLSPKATMDNLDTIISRLKQRGIKVLLAGMLSPPNMGREYEDAFNTIYPALATKHEVPLYPFFLDGVAGQPTLNQADGMHPTEAGIDEIVARFLPFAIRLAQDITGNNSALR